MYLLNAQSTIEWTLDKTSNVVLLADLAIVTVEPDGTTTFAAVDNLIAPTSDADGLVTYAVIPDTEGLWDITLVKGNAETYVTLSQALLQVFDNDTIVEAVSDSGGSLDITGNQHQAGHQHGHD